MANYRQIHVSIWKDEWFLDLAPDEKLLFIYLFSNESTSLAGIYKLPLKVIEFETGLDRARILEIIEIFSAANKVQYQDGIVWVVNMRKYHETKSDRVQKRIEKDIASIPDSPLKIRYGYGIDTEQQLKEEEEEIKEEEEEEVVTSPPRLRHYLTGGEAEEIYRKVVQTVYVPRDHVEEITDAIRAIWNERNGGTIEYLRPYFEVAKARYGKNVKLFWLTEWAARGEIPLAKGEKPPPRKKTWDEEVQETLRKAGING